jgi:hypothetical protein
VLSVAVVCAAAVLVGAAAPEGAFGVGVLRRDGLVIPFATFDGKNWRNAWPSPAADPAVPINVASVPQRWWGPTGPVESWHAWLRSSEQSIRVTQPDWVQVLCARHLALRTDYKASGIVPPDEEQPYPKDGLAVSSAQPIDRIAVLEPTAIELNDLGPALLRAFNDAERNTASGANHPMSRRGREAIQPAIDAAYAFGASPRYYYVEAVRAYRELGQTADQCLATAYGTGWFIREGGTVRSVVTAVDLLPCNRFGASYMLPLGIVRSGARIFWLAQFSGWDHERYAVLELTPKKIEVMVTTWGGGC